MAQLEALMQQNFLEYSSYFVLDRAIPDIRDGLKPVQRRILHTLFSMNDGRYHKVANVIGETMKLHPHGDASIGDALVVLANKNYFIDRQGNFGNLDTGHPAAAARYIECRLTDLALETLFHRALTEFVPSYDGRNEEPVALPSKLPVVLMLGTEGIAVGMATKLLPHNLPELWKAQIAIIEGKSVELYPDFQSGGLMDVDAYEDGRGKVEVRAKISVRDKKHVIISEIPYGTTTESIIASIEAAAQKGRVKISSINDYTTDHVEIELALARGVTAKEVIPQLYAYTDCSVSVSSNVTVIQDRKPLQLTITQIITALTEHLKQQLKAELEYDRDQLLDKQHWLTLEQIFVEKRVYKGIEEARTSDAVRSEVMTGMAKYKKQFVRPMVEEDVTRLLDIRIRRISAYDIEKNRKDIEAIEAELKAVNAKLRNMKKTTIGYVKALLEKYGDQYPRRTEVTKIKAVDKKAVATQNLKVAYDADSGFFGTVVRGDMFKMAVSEYDLILGISSDGSYRIMPPPEKVLFTGKLIYCEIFDPDKGAEFTVIYRDKKKIGFGKRIKIEKFIRNKEYHLIKGKEGKVLHLLPGNAQGTLDIGFVPAKRQRVKTATFDLADLTLISPTARGVRIAPKPVAKVKHVAPATKAKQVAQKAAEVDEDGQGKLLSRAPLRAHPPAPPAPPAPGPGAGLTLHPPPPSGAPPRGRGARREQRPPAPRARARAPARGAVRGVPLPPRAPKKGANREGGPPPPPPTGPGGPPTPGGRPTPAPPVGRGRGAAQEHRPRVGHAEDSGDDGGMHGSSAQSQRGARTSNAQNGRTAISPPVDEIPECGGVHVSSVDRDANRSEPDRSVDDEGAARLGGQALERGAR